MNLLFVVPHLSRLGGVASHYKGLHPYWSHPFSYEYYGKRKHIPALLVFPFDLLKYLFKLTFLKIDVVVVNPSFRKYQLIRDGIYLLLAKMLDKQVVTFFHGWDARFADSLEKRPRLFRYVYNQSSLLFVLSTAFKEQLRRMGICRPVVLTTTKVDDTLLSSFDPSRRDGNIRQILFLARILKTKGIYIALDAFSLLRKDYPRLKLLVCGDGPELAEARRYAANRQIGGVRFAGAVAGRRLAEAFEESDLYLLPSYEEGMATSVLEAMAFGLPVVSRPVGGIVDFFTDGEMGYLLPSYNPHDFYRAIKRLIANPQLVRRISETNRLYARRRFMASTVAKTLEEAFDNYLK